MIQELNTKTTVSGVFAYILVYAGWILTTLLGLVTILYTRQVLNMLWRTMGLYAGINPIIMTTRVHFYDQLETLILFPLWAIFAFFAEHHYRSSVSAARNRQIKEEMARSHQATAAQHESRWSIREWGIDIVARRFLITTSIPVALLAIAYLIGQITLRNLQ